MHRIFAAFVFIPCLLTAAPRSADDTWKLLEAGRKLTGERAAALEERVRTKPHDEEARIELLSFYEGKAAGIDAANVRASRSAHILWIIENDPNDGLGLFHIGTGVHRLNCEGDDLADPEPGNRAAALWMRQVGKDSKNAGLKRIAADQIRFCAPEQAERLLLEIGDQKELGRFYSAAALGVTGLDYRYARDPINASAALRTTAFAQKAIAALSAASNPDCVITGAETLLRFGGILWADGKLDWDYTDLARPLLAKARQASPGEVMLFTLKPELPPRGVRPPEMLAISGRILSAKVIRQVDPVYPPQARAAGIGGSVSLRVLVDPDGKIAYLYPQSGPKELVPSAIEAVRQWEYKPTLYNNRPCYISTTIQINFVRP